MDNFTRITMNIKQIIANALKKKQPKKVAIRDNSVLGRIKSALDAGEHLSGLSGLTSFGSMKLTSRISDLRKQGYNVKDYWNYSDDGKKRWKVYYKG